MPIKLENISVKKKEILNRDLQDVRDSGTLVVQSVKQ